MSTIKVNTISNVAATASTAVENVIHGSAKAWVNFNGTGTVAVRASYNVTSITDNGVGLYTVNFTTAMIDTNYAVMTGVDRTTDNNAQSVLQYEDQTINSVQLVAQVTISGGVLEDQLGCCCAIFR